MFLLQTKILRKQKQIRLKSTPSLYQKGEILTSPFEENLFCQALKFKIFPSAVDFMIFIAFMPKWKNIYQATALQFLSWKTAVCYYLLWRLQIFENHSVNLSAERKIYQLEVPKKYYDQKPNSTQKCSETKN